MNALKPKTGFDWSHVAWGHPDSPRSFLCSYCSAPMNEDVTPLVLCKAGGYLAQFCDKCMSKWWGMQTFTEEEEDDGRDS